MGNLPEHIYGLQDYAPVEDLLLPILREGLDPIPVYSLIPDGADIFPFALVRRAYSQQHWRGDHRGFLDHGYFKIDTFTNGVDADADGAALQEAARAVLVKAWLNNTLIETPQGAASIRHLELLLVGRREPDWATATGPVQYADLPTGTHRYESTYRAHFRYER